MLTVCNFHYIRNNFDAPYPSIFGVTPYEFENQLLKLSETGEFINQKIVIEDIDSILASKKNFILITFDDGLKEQYVLAKPILDKMKIEAIYFINSINYIEKEVSQVHKIHLLRSQIPTLKLLNRIENLSAEIDFSFSEEDMQNAKLCYNYDDFDSAYLKYLLNFKLTTDQTAKIINTLFDEYFNTNSVVANLYMTKEQLLTLSSLNMLGSHTHSHFPLGLLNPSLIKKELETTKYFIDSFGHKNSFSVSYPFGNRDSCKTPVPEFAKEIGHKIGFAFEPGINRFGENHLLLKRFDCNDLIGGKNYKKK
jgi:peptidoglycan/xylan/chitin deacetylase (PgdA/CDA1 family)